MFELFLAGVALLYDFFECFVDGCCSLVLLGLKFSHFFADFDGLAEIGHVSTQLLTLCFLFYLKGKQAIPAAGEFELQLLFVPANFLQVGPQLFISGQVVPCFFLCSFQLFPWDQLFSGLLQLLLSYLQCIVVFLSENVNLLGTVVDLSAALIELALQRYVFGLQLFVFLLQQSQSFFLFRASLFESLVDSRQFLLLAAMALQSSFAFPQSSHCFISFLSNYFKLLFQVCYLFEQILILIINFLDYVGIILCDFCCHLFEFDLPLCILRLEGVLFLLQRQDGLFEEAHLFVSQLYFLALHFQPTSLVPEQLHRLLAQLNHRLPPLEHSNYNIKHIHIQQASLGQDYHQQSLCKDINICLIVTGLVHILVYCYSRVDEQHCFQFIFSNNNVLNGSFI